VKTHAGWVYAAFILDVYSRMVVGWQISNSLRSELAIDALEMAIWNRTRAGQVLDGLVHHSDRGVQYLSRQAQVPHEPLDGAAGYSNAFPVELGPHLAGPVHVQVVGMYPDDLCLQVLVAHRAG
jgi:hypothetical protein